jgi:DNA repair exonuclease SbcCD nuclease subunit
LKILIYSDIQFYPWREFSRTLPNGRNSRLEDQLNVQDEIFRFSVENSIDLLVHTGDLFEELSQKIDKEVFLSVFSKFVDFSKKKIPVILLAGNHDQLTKTDAGLHILEPFKEIKNLVVIDRTTVETIDNIDLCFIPYKRNNFLDEVKTVINLSVSKNRYLFTHQGVSGAKIGSRDYIIKDSILKTDFFPKEFTAIFNGHYHKAQMLLDNFVIVGSPLQKDFGERLDQKGFWVVDTNKSLKDIEFIETHAPRFFKVDLVDEVIKFPKTFSNKDFLWVVSNNEQISNSPQITLLGNRVRLDIQRKIDIKLRSDIKLGMDVKDQLKNYIQMVKSELDESKLLQMGLDKWKKSM